MNTYNSHNWLSCTAYFVLWLLISAALLMATWNHVVGTVAKVKNVKYWHALVLLVTVSFVCVIPKLCMSRYGHGGYGMHGFGSCDRHKGNCDKGDHKVCDHHGSKDSDDKE